MTLYLQIKYYQLVLLLVAAAMIPPSLCAQDSQEPEAKIFAWQPISRSLNLEVFYGFNLLNNPSAQFKPNARESSSWQIAFRYQKALANDLIGLYAGLSIGKQWMRWSSDTLYLGHIDNQTQFASVQSIGLQTDQIKRSTFSTLQLGLPILFEIRPMKRRKKGLAIGIGGYLQYLLYMRNKITYTNGKF